ncbi:MAG: hemin receptor, partial [Winogradskyella sp.]|nr:hemin receptor [Winogradskyella sp.]
LSLDYTRRNFNGIRFSNGDFFQENQNIQDRYRNTYNLNIGTEWRFDRFSIRGGYIFEQSPDRQALETDHLEGYAFGAGYNFGNFKLDFSFTDNNRNAPYNFYSGFNVNPAELSINNRVFTGTLTINL